MVVLQVPADGVCAGVQALLGQLFAQTQHKLHRRGGVFGRRLRGSNAASPSAR
jgi:hypothetical protein